MEHGRRRVWADHEADTNRPGPSMCLRMKDQTTVANSLSDCSNRDCLTTDFQEEEKSRRHGSVLGAEHEIDTVHNRSPVARVQEEGGMTLFRRRRKEESVLQPPSTSGTQKQSTVASIN